MGKPSPWSVHRLISSSYKLSNRPPIQFEERITKLETEPKSILATGKDNRYTRKDRNVVFDQAILFLDAAYEGEYDLLVELAGQVPDISVGNGEGITALHNAICAGNHNIVKFLIDHHADVNALVSDMVWGLQGRSAQSGT